MLKRGKHQVEVQSCWNMNFGAQYEVVYWRWGFIPTTVRIHITRSRAEKSKEAMRRLKGLK